MGWKEAVADYFVFTRRDRIAVVTLLLLILFIFFLPDLLTRNQRPKPLPADTAWIAALKRLGERETDPDSYPEKNDDNPASYQYDRPRGNYHRREGELFYFDPNTLSDPGWKRLGLRDKTIHTIRNYLDKGGRFREPRDLERIYGLFPDEFERIAPYIRIATTGETSRFKDFVRDTQQNTRKPVASRYTVVDINLADTSALVALPGIGNKLAARIISFRDKLGGFYSINQVAETYGLPDSSFQKIKQYLKLENIFLRRININTATLEELKAHPYIRWSLASPIIAYREEHGPFAKVQDIKKVMAVTEEIYTRISAYLIHE